MLTKIAIELPDTIYRLCPACHEGFLQFTPADEPYHGDQYTCGTCLSTHYDSDMRDDSTRLVSKKYVDDMANELFLEIDKLRDILRGLLG